MMTFEVSAGPPYLSTGSGPTTGVLFVDCGGWSFPEAGWRDFVSVVLTWWLEAISGVGTGDDCSLEFMDGPFRIDVRRDDEAAYLRFVIRTSEGERVVREGVAGWAAVVTSISEASHSVASTLRARDSDAEVAGLAQALMLLSEEDSRRS